MPLDKTKLGTRYTCFSCGTKFYDLNRPTASCPECGADQSEAPVQDLKMLLARGRRGNDRPSKDLDLDTETQEGDDGDDDDDGLFDESDDDDDGGDDDDDDLADDDE